MNNYSVSEIKADEAFIGELILDPLFLIEPAKVPVGRSVLIAVAEWEFDTLLCDAKKVEVWEGDAESGKKKSDIDISATEEVSMDDFLSDSPSPHDQSPKLPSAPPPPAPKAKELAEDTPKASASKASISNTIPLRAIPPSMPKMTASSQKEEEGTKKVQYSEASRMEAVKKMYAMYEKYLYDLYTRYTTHGDIDKENFQKTVQEMCSFIRENTRYVLRVVPSEDARRGNVFVSHTMRSTVIAVAIGLEMRLGSLHLVELCTTCILHEIGMLLLPPQIYDAKKTLTASERALVEAHPTKGAAIASALGFSDSVKNGIEDHHECKNGTGYPNRKMGDRISIYGKIISVACSYEAITAPRQYKQARSAFEAMVEMLKNKDQRYDDTVIKALLYSLSLFPIGAFVFLSDGRIAQVTGVNPTDPKNPIVQLINEHGENGQPITVQTSSTVNKIVRVLSRQEIYDAVKSMKR